MYIHMDKLDGERREGRKGGRERERNDGLSASGTKAPNRTIPVVFKVELLPYG